MNLPRLTRTLLFSTLYPSSVRPRHGIFVETRLRELLGSGEIETKVIAPVPWFFSKHPRYGEFGRMASTPLRETHHGIDVQHPRYLLPPKVGMNIAPFTLALGAAPAAQRLLDEGFDFDLIDAHYYYPDGVAAALLGKWLNKPVVITARGTDLNLIPQFPLPRRMIRWASMQAQASIGVCSALMDVLRDMGTPADRLHVMRNGVDLQRFQPQPQEASRSALGLSGSPILLSVGYLIERKGHHLLLQAMPEILKHYPHARLVVVGDGDMRGALLQLARDLQIEAHVTFAGAIAQAELKHWYSAADVFVLASSREGWANVLLESMACGTPVVATRIWGTPEVVTDERVGLLVDHRNAEAFAAAVSRLLAHPPDRSQVRSYAEGYSWESTSQAQLELFNRLAARTEASCGT